MKYKKYGKRGGQVLFLGSGHTPEDRLIPAHGGLYSLRNIERRKTQKTPANPLVTFFFVFVLLLMQHVNSITPTHSPTMKTNRGNTDHM